MSILSDVNWSFHNLKLSRFLWVTTGHWQPCFVSSRRFHTFMPLPTVFLPSDDVRKKSSNICKYLEHLSFEKLVLLLLLYFNQKPVDNSVGNQYNGQHCGMW